MLSNFKYRISVAAIAGVLVAAAAGTGMGGGVARADSTAARTNTTQNTKDELAIKPIRVELK